MSKKTPSSNGPPATGWFRVDNVLVDLIGEIGQLAFCVYCALAKFSDRERQPRLFTRSVFDGVDERRLDTSMVMVAVSAAAPPFPRGLRAL